LRRSRRRSAGSDALALRTARHGRGRAGRGTGNRSRSRCRGGLEYREVPESELTPAQKAFFDEQDRKLAACGYAPLCCYRILHLDGRNIARLYQSAANSGIAFVAAMTKSNISTSYLELVQDFQDGTRLSTRNTQFSTVFDHGPKDILQEFPAVREPEELKRRHEHRLRRLGLIPVSTGDKDLIFKRGADHQRRFCEYQVSRGLLRFDAKSDSYRATYRTGLYGIRNFLNPFGDNFSLPRFFLALAAGLGLPAAAAHFAAPSWAVWLCYLAAGAVIGYLFTGKAFTWGFLLGFAASRLWPQHQLESALLGLAMGVATEAGRRLRNRLERLV
jgi:hypothetical protein